MDQQYQDADQQNTVPPLSSATPQFEPQGGVPSWDYIHEIGFKRALFYTIKEVLINPTDTFRRMLPTGNLGKAFLYVLMLSVVAALIGVLFQTLIQMAFALLTSAFSHAPLRSTVLVFGGGMLNIFFVFFASLIGTCISIPLQAGLIHLALMILAKTRQPFESTFRVVCYSCGSTAVWSMIPFIGGIISIIWNLVCTIIGVKEQNRISTGIAVLVVLLPLALMMICCCLLILGSVSLIVAFTGMNIDQLLKQIHF